MCLLAIWRNSFTTFLLTQKSITVEWKIGYLCAEEYYTAIKTGGPGLYTSVSLDVGHPVLSMSLYPDVLTSGPLLTCRDCPSQG